MIFGKPKTPEEAFGKHVKDLLNDAKRAYRIAEPHMGPKGGPTLLLISIALFEILKHLSARSPELSKELSKRQDFYETLMQKMEKTFPVDYYAVYNNYFRNEFADNAIRQICLIAFTALAREFQGKETRLDMEAAVAQLRPIVERADRVGNVVDWREALPINQMMTSFRYREQGALTSLTHKQLYKRGKEFESSGGDAFAEEFIDKAIENLLNKKPMGKNLSTLEQYMKERDEVHESRMGRRPRRKRREEPEEEATFNFEDHIIREPNPVPLEDVIGNERAKEAIEKVLIAPRMNPDWFETYPTNILLFGPPGCGKTYLASAVANEMRKSLGIDVTFLKVEAPDIMSKYWGTAEKNVKELFEEARRSAANGETVIIFMDELDGVMQEDAREVDMKVLNQFQTELDGLESKGKKTLPIYLIGATNKPWVFKEAMLSRFPERIYVEPPSPEERAQLFKKHLKGLGKVWEIDEMVSYGELARRTHGYSGRDIRDMCQDVSHIVWRDMKSKGTLSGKPRKITMDDCIKAIEKRKPSMSSEGTKELEEWNQEHGTG